MKQLSRPELVDNETAAKILTLSPQTLNGWRHRGQGPKFVKLGRAVRYRLRDLEEFIGGPISWIPETDQATE